MSISLSTKHSTKHNKITVIIVIGRFARQDETMSSKPKFVLLTFICRWQLAGADAVNDNFQIE